MSTAKFFAVCILLLTVTNSTCLGQTDGFLKDFLERWENSKKYVIAVAEAMPESEYNFRPTPGEMTFGEQLIHIAFGIDYHIQTLIVGRKPRDEKDSTFSAGKRSRQELINIVTRTFDDASVFIAKFDPMHLDDRHEKNGRSRTNRQLFLLLTDHVTHHKAQMIVYLRLNGIVPPEYGKYQ